MFKKTAIILLLVLIVIPAIVFADGESFLKNGDFENGEYEDGLPTDWFSEMWVNDSEVTEISVIDIDGNGTLKISNTYENDARIAQNVKVKGNKIYKLSGYISTFGITGGRGANLSFEDIMDTTESVFDTQGEWQYVEMYGKTSLFQSSIKVFVRVGGYGALSQGEAFFDNVKLEEVKDVPKGAAVVSLKKPNPTKTEKEDGGIKFLIPSIFITIAMVLLYLYFKDKLFANKLSDNHIDLKSAFWIIIFSGTAIRLLLSVIVRGYPNDISCWIGWSNACTQYGLFNMYHSDIWIDYPPGYMYILNVLGYLMKLLQNIFGVVPDRLQWLIVKLPPIAADIGLSVFIYKIAKPKVGEVRSLLIMGIYFLSPVVIMNSSAWGQIDGILALFAVLYILALYNRKFWIAGIFLAVGVLMKIQMVLFAPLYLTAAWSYFKEKKGWAFTSDVLLGVLTGLATLAVLAMPFYIGEGRNPLGFVKIYTDSLGTYSSVSLNAANLWALLGGMWKPVDTPFMGITYGLAGNIGLVLSIAAFLAIGFLDRKKESIFVHAAFLITGIFMLSGKMHERYMFTALPLLLMSVLYARRRSSYILFIIFSATQFMNTALVLANDYIYGNSMWTMLISVAAVLGFAYMVYVCIRMYKGSPEVFEKEINNNSGFIKASDKEPLKIESEEGFFKKLNRWDALLMTGLTLVYAIVAFVNLGSLVGAETNFKTVTPNSEVIVDFGEVKNVSEIWFFRGKSSSGASFYVSFSNEKDGEYKTEDYIRITHGGMFDDTDSETAEREKIKSDFGIDGEIYDRIFFSNYPDVLKWFNMKSEVTARYAKVTFEKPSLYIFELGFKDPEGNIIPIKDLTYDTTNEKMPFDLLFDEQDTIPETENLMNSTYFDEIYHAGTAWEHLNYIDPYETTHPPLGKVIMSWGIKIFGLNTFGWRFMGTLVGVLMVPVMYLLAKLLFKKTRYAFIAAFLMTFDFMHFVQTRIATIDSYGVFFIMLMYLLMGIYFYMSYNKTPLIKTLIPLGLSGIFFGLGAASKWIGLYAGAGLAILFFISLYKRWSEYLYAKYDGTGMSQIQRDDITDAFTKKTLITLAWCVLFFIVIPIGIYVASYIPIMKIGPSKDLSYVWRNQENMFSYHSGLDSSHPFASKWYEWPFLIKPMWFYSNDAVRGTGYMASIATFGNPAVWWIGTLSMLYLFVDTYLHRKIPKESVFIIIAFISQFLPWVFIDRSMFIYHYFASVPFVVLSITYAIRNLEERYKMKKWAILVYLAVVLALFAMFYPVLSGTVIPSWYGKLLKWLPSWWFTY